MAFVTTPGGVVVSTAPGVLIASAAAIHGFQRDSGDKQGSRLVGS